MSTSTGLHPGPLLLAATLAGICAQPLEAEAFPYLPPSPGNIIAPTNIFESQCLTPAAQFWALFDSDLADSCSAIAEQMIQDDVEELAALGLLEDDLESIKHYTRDTNAEVFPTPGVQHRTHNRSPQQWLQMSWDSWDDIMSCDEYVYKRFFDVSEFRRIADEYAGDPMAYMDIAFDGGMGTSLATGGDFVDNDGLSWPQDQPPLVGGLEASFQTLHPNGQAKWTFAPKNDFFDLTFEERSAVAAHSNLTTWFLYGGYYGGYTDSLGGGWTLHQQRYQALQDEPIATLSYFRDVRGQFVEFRDRRRRMVDEFSFYFPEEATHLVDMDPEGDDNEIIAPAYAPIEFLPSSYSEAQDDFYTCLLANDRSFRDLEDLNSPVCSAQRAAYKQMVRHELNRMNIEFGLWLTRAESMGCLDGAVLYNSPVAVCDWSPADFLEDVGTTLQTCEGDSCAPVADRMEQERASCVGAAPDWPTLIYGDQNDVAYHYYASIADYMADTPTRTPVVADFFLSVADVDLYLERLRDEVNFKIESIDDTVATLERGNWPKLQYVASDQWSARADLGIPGVTWDEVASGYSYAYDIGLIDRQIVAGLEDDREDTYDAQNPLCKPHPHAAAHFDAWGEAFGESINAVEFNFDARVFEEDQDYFWSTRLDFSLLGIDLFTPVCEGACGDGAGDLQLNHPYNISGDSKRLEKDLLDPRVPFALAGIPMSTRTVVTGVVGLDWDIDVTAGARNDTNECFELVAGGDITLTPYLSLSATGKAGPDLYLVSAGAYVNVELLGMKLPMKGGIELTSADGFSSVKADVSMDIDVTFTTSGGSVGVYVEALSWEERWGYDWEGATTNVNLYDQDYSWRTEIWDGVCSVMSCI